MFLLNNTISSSKANGESNWNQSLKRNGHVLSFKQPVIRPEDLGGLKGIRWHLSIQSPQSSIIAAFLRSYNIIRCTPTSLSKKAWYNYQNIITESLIPLTNESSLELDISKIKELCNGRADIWCCYPPTFSAAGKRGKGQVEKQVGGTADIWAPE